MDAGCDPDMLRDTVPISGPNSSHSVVTKRDWLHPKSPVAIGFEIELNPFPIIGLLQVDRREWNGVPGASETGGYHMAFECASTGK